MVSTRVLEGRHIKCVPVPMCTVSNKIETSRLNTYICPHSFIPLASKAQSHSNAVEITVKKLTSLASIPLGGLVMAANRKTRHDNTVTSRQYGRRALATSDFKMATPVDLGKLGRALYSIFFFFLSMSVLALEYFAIKYTHRTTVLLWGNGLCDIWVLVMYVACQRVWRVAQIRSNVRTVCMRVSHGVISL